MKKPTAVRVFSLLVLGIGLGVLTGCPLGPLTPELSYASSVERFAWSEGDAALIATAESVYPARDDVLAEAETGWFGSDPATLPEGDLWWYGDFDCVRLPYAITSETVAYYEGLIEQWQAGDFGAGPVMGSASLNYTAQVYHQDTDPEFPEYEDMDVVVMYMEWMHICGPLCGLGFTKDRVVILSALGEVLAVYGDGELLEAWVS